MISQEHPSGRVFAQVCVDSKRTMITESTVVSQCNVDDYFVDDPSILTPPISNHASEEFCSHLNENLPLSPSSTTKVVDNEESIQEPLSPISTKDAVLMITVINETDRFDENDEKETILSTPSSDADCDPSKENTTIECDSYRCSPSPSLPLTPLAGDDDICDEQQEASLICQVESGSPSCPSSPRRFLVKSHRHHPYNGRSGHHQRRTPPSVSCDSTNRTVLTKHYTMHLDYSSRIPSPLHIDTILANAQSSTNRAEAHKHKVRLAKQIQSVILADDFAQLVKLLNSQTDKPDLNVFINGQTALHYCLLLGTFKCWINEGIVAFRVQTTITKLAVQTLFQ